MTLYDFIKNGYSSLFDALSFYYPAMLETAKEVQIIPWRDEWVEGCEKNPEVIVQIKELERMLKRGEITREEYEQKLNSISTTYASRVAGISFIESKQVSFRDIKDEMPSEYLIVHELGHIHFRETDLFWNSTYGGGEILVWLTLKGRYHSSEEQVRLFMQKLHETYTDHRKVADEIVQACWQDSFAQTPEERPNFYRICLAAGWIPDGIMRDPKLLEAPWLGEPTKRDVLNFFQSLTSGLQWDDPFWVHFAKQLGFVEGAKHFDSPRSKPRRYKKRQRGQ